LNQRQIVFLGRVMLSIIVRAQERSQAVRRLSTPHRIVEIVRIGHGIVMVAGEWYSALSDQQMRLFDDPGGSFPRLSTALQDFVNTEAVQAAAGVIHAKFPSVGLRM